MGDLDASPLTSAGASLAGVAGAVLGLTFAVVAGFRRSKPLHPVGTVAAARLTLAPRGHRSGSSLLDEPGEHECLVRASHAVGTGPRHADIEGFALRVLSPDGHAVQTDLLSRAPEEDRWAATS